MPTITPHICPPLKLCGVVVRSVHISVSFSFHTPRAFSKLLMIQLSLMRYTPFVSDGAQHHSTPMVESISLEKAISKPPNRHRKPCVR